LSKNTRLRIRRIGRHHQPAADRTTSQRLYGRVGVFDPYRWR